MWTFLTRGRGETEGFSNGSLAEFKGNPLQALAREICQNSLDAADGSGKPVIVEIKSYLMPIDDFPGMTEMRGVIKACDNFWSGKGDVNTITFLDRAKQCLKDTSGKFMVLRISDYNTKGVEGAFSDEDITPWGSLVKGNAFSVKADENNAAGSFGIGKAAPFVSSYFQTVFYRTYDHNNTRAALGVARLMAHESVRTVTEGEDPVRRSVGYYGLDNMGKPSVGFSELDSLFSRDQYGTDLFIPGFNGITSDESWVDDILKEVAENFLYSVYSGKLEVKVEKRTLNQSNLGDMLVRIGSKDAKNFFKVISSNPDVVEQTKAFHNLGTLRLRLLFDQDLNKKILVVRNSGMKIARISSLPRMISYTGFLELQGDALNGFFRAMENPSHNAWEPKRHSDPKKAKAYKEELEQWVIDTITEKLVEISGEESSINIGDCFSFDEEKNGTNSNKAERILNDSESYKTEAFIPITPRSGKISIRDEGRTRDSSMIRGKEDPSGTAVGHRHRTGTHPGGRPTGRRVTPDPDGDDTVNNGPGGSFREVPITARIISQNNGIKKLIFTAKEEIALGRIEIITKGENGRSLVLKVDKVFSSSADAEAGHIVIHDIPANIKQSIEFELPDDHVYAMGVKAYGD